MIQVSFNLRVFIRLADFGGEEISWRTTSKKSYLSLFRLISHRQKCKSYAVLRIHGNVGPSWNFWVTDLLFEQALSRMQKFGMIREYYVDYKTSLVTMISFSGRFFQANAFWTVTSIEPDSEHWIIPLVNAYLPICNVIWKEMPGSR